MFKRYLVFICILFVFFGMISCKNPTVTTPDLEVATYDPDNEAPYPIIGPGSLDVTIPPGSSSINLEVDKLGGQNDPDGDEVSFHYSIAYRDAGSVDDVIVNISNVGGIGVMTVTHPGSVFYDEFVCLNLWTMDSHGSCSTVFTPFALFYDGE